jgi:phosphoglycerol transferase MdoB-like AlkP superfamily enzyme
MLKTLSLVLRFILFWLLVFNFQRLLFAFHYFSRIVNEGGSEFWNVFLYAFRLDLATMGFIALITLPFCVAFLLSNQKKTSIYFKLLIFSQVLILLLVSLIHCGEINVYSEWNHKLTTRVFTHLIHPDEVFRTATLGNYVYFFLYLIIELVFGCFLLKKLFKNAFDFTNENKRKYLTVALFTIFISPLSFLAARGGWQPIPVTINAAIHSHSPIVNDVSVNSSYFFAENLLLYKKLDLESFLAQTPSHSAQMYVDSMLVYPKKHDQYFLTNKRPNIVFVVLESWAAEAISYSGVCEGSTPYFDSLIHEGLYFDQFYSGGGTSEVGNAGIFGGIPALPQVSVTMFPNKSRKLPSINQLLKPLGYSSAYLFGGDLDYGNIGGYFMDHNFDVVEDENDFPNNLKRGKLNVYDPDLYQKFIENIRQAQQPFFQCVFTGSTHAPYDIPQEWQGFWQGNENGFMDGLHFSDHALHEFIEQCKQEPWFDSTLFVFVADHGRITPKSPSFFDTKFFRVPLLFWGNVLNNKYKGLVSHTIGGQVDLVATLFYQMGIDSSPFIWSKDLMNPKVPQFALYTSTIGYGFKEKQGEFYYLTTSNQYEINTFPMQEQTHKLDVCRMYLRAIWDHFKAL